MAVLKAHAATSKGDGGLVKLDDGKLVVFDRRFASI